jgi:sugar phosphate isomerase/epimerase
MMFSCTTRWNAGRHDTGEAMIDELLELGFDHVELGYDLREHLVPGVLSRVKAGQVAVDSLHAYCPLPPGVPFPSPEPFTLASLHAQVRATALRYLEDTIRFAATVDARIIVLHAGNVDMKPLSPRLTELAATGRLHDDEYDKLRMKLLLAREKAVAHQIDYLYAGIERVLPLLESTGCVLALELLPAWESIPTEIEMERLLSHFSSPRIRCWHDLGHGQIRENLGFTNHLRWVKRLRPWLAGMHIHDVQPPATDHLMPPHGTLDFSLFRDIVQGDIVRVLEPAPSTTAEEIIAGRHIIAEAWRARESPSS